MARRRWGILLALFSDRTTRPCCFVDDAVIDVEVGFVQRLCVALPWRQWSDNALGTCQSNGGIDAGGIESHGILKCGGQIIGSRWNGSLAWAALWSACRIEEAIGGLGWCRGTDWCLFSRLVLAAGKEARHEACHDVDMQWVRLISQQEESWAKLARAPLGANSVAGRRIALNSGLAGRVLLGSKGRG